MPTSVGRWTERLIGPHRTNQPHNRVCIYARHGSFYHLPSTIIRHEKHKLLKAAYSFYNVATTMSLPELMRDSLVLAKEKEVDVFNALDVMQNSDFLQELKFGPGDGHLQVGTRSHIPTLSWAAPPIVVRGSI